MDNTKTTGRREFLGDLCKYAAVPLALALGADSAQAADTAPKVIAARCNGCGKCARVAQKTFAVNPRTRKAYVKNPKGDPVPIVRKAAQVCRTKAIVAP